jgi:hypothetical protein
LIQIRKKKRIEVNRSESRSFLLSD